jgi:hypothetical protein
MVFSFLGKILFSLLAAGLRAHKAGWHKHP